MPNKLFNFFIKNNTLKIKLIGNVRYKKNIIKTKNLN